MSASSADTAPSGFIDRLARREYLLICLAGFLFSVSHNYSALLAIVFERSGHSLQATGLLLSLFSITAISGSLASSAVCARLGVMRAIRWAIFLTCISMASFALTRETFVLALLSRLVQGVGVGLLVPVALVYVQSRITRANFVVLITGFSAGIPLASAIAPPLGEWTLKHYGETALFIEAAFPAALGVLATIGLRDAQRPANTGGLNLQGGFAPHLWLPYIVVLAGGGLYGYSVNYLAASMQERAILLGAFFIPSSISLVLMRLGAIWIMRQLNPRTLVTLSLLTYGIGFAFIAAASGYAAMIIGGVFFGIGNSIMFPVVAAWVGENVPPERRAAPQAVNNASFYFGMYALPFPQAYLIGHFGYIATEWAWAAVAFALTAVMLVVLARYRPGAGKG
ncbi:MAG: MFS transporter [Hyphomicrobiales bacterium]|nr:MFS transporter [Hyphomicrobiales bacterium]